MGIFSAIGGALKGIAGVAAPVLGGLVGGPLGAAVGSGIGGLFSGGGGQAAQNAQLQDLQRRSAADAAQRAPLRNLFTEGIQNAGNISAPDLTGRLGGTTQAQTGLIGQQLGLGEGTGQQAGQRLGQAGGLFGEAGNAAQQAGGLFSGSVEGLPQFTGIGAGSGDFSRGLNQDAAGRIGGGQLPGFQGIGAGQFGSSGQTRGLEGQAIGAVGGALGAPGIGQAAQGQLQNIFEQSEDARRLGARDIGRSAAAFGRTGSGVVNTELGNLEERIQRGQQQAFRGLAGDTATAEAGDRLARAGLGLGAAGQFQGRDLSTAGFQQGLRGEARGERGQEFDQAAARAGLGIQQGQALSGIGQTQFGQDSSLRGEARGERGNQLDESFRRAQLGQQAGQGLLGVSGAQGELGSRVGQLGALGQDLDIQRLNSQRGERGFQAGQDQQQFQNRNQVFGQEQGALGQQQQFELERLRQAGQVGFGGPNGGIGVGDLGVLNNLTDTQNQNIQQQEDLAAGIGGLFGGGAADPAAAAQSQGFNPNQNIFAEAPVGQFAGQAVQNQGGNIFQGQPVGQFGASSQAQPAGGLVSNHRFQPPGGTPGFRNPNLQGQFPVRRQAPAGQFAPFQGPTPVLKQAR